MSEEIEKEEIETEETEEETETEEEETDETEEEVKENLKSYIQSETKTASEKALDEKLEEMSNSLVEKFFNGVAKQRKQAIDSGKKIIKKETEQQQIKTWFNALINRDFSTLKRIQKDYIQVGDNDSAGYLVPPALVAEVNRFTEQYGVARRDMRYLPFSGAGNERNIPALVNSVSTYWLGEGEVKPSTQPTFKLVKQTLSKIAAIVPMTEEILEDSAINIIALLGELFGEAIAYEEDRVFLAGDTDSGDVFNGVINATGVVPVVIGSDNPASDDFGGVFADALNRAMYSVPTSVRNNGKFYMNSAFFSILQRVKDSDGRYLIQGPIGNTPPTLWTRPFELTDVLPSDDATGEGTPIAFYTDLKKTCVYGDKYGLKTKLLDQAIVESAEESPSNLNLATQDMIALRIVKRVGYVPILPSGIAVLTLGAES